MTLRPLLPVWALLVTLVPLAVLAVSQLRAATPGRNRWAWLRRTAMVVLLAVVGLGPSVLTRTEQVMVSNVEVFFVVDRTGSMVAEDYGPDAEPRLVGVRQDLVDLTAALPAARYSIVSFTSEASRQLPLTSDATAVGAWAQTVVQEITEFSAGSNVGAALPVLEQALTSAAEAHPENVRLVFVFTDGENTSGRTVPSFAHLAPLVDGGAVLGYGTEAGGRMRAYDGSYPPNPNAPYIRDYSQPDEPDAVSRIDTVAMAALADQLGVPSVHRAAPGGAAELVGGIDSQLIADDGRRDVPYYDAVHWPFALGLAALLVWEVYTQASPWARRRT